ncbi:hypothetical protein BLNAU_7477 [Blattamonas nauphoetae]|uniref:Uncharacterized protein n=1 Tax=Blattamonas nauphoetae TaxID=2049346 RepID=A0ABQ9Y1J1_9EUKA|nr:hypothetical protein BLNAU_7477 [Blattamonas nauphoetae]
MPSSTEPDRKTSDELGYSMTAEYAMPATGMVQTKSDEAKREKLARKSEQFQAAERNKWKWIRGRRRGTTAVPTPTPSEWSYTPSETIKGQTNGKRKASDINDTPSRASSSLSIGEGGRRESVKTTGQLEKGFVVRRKDVKKLFEVTEDPNSPFFSEDGKKKDQKKSKRKPIGTVRNDKGSEILKERLLSQEINKPDTPITRLLRDQENKTAMEHSFHVSNPPTANITARRNHDSTKGTLNDPFPPPPTRDGDRSYDSDRVVFEDDSQVESQIHPNSLQNPPTTDTVTFVTSVVPQERSYQRTRSPPSTTQNPLSPKPKSSGRDLPAIRVTPTLERQREILPGTPTHRTPVPSLVLPEEANMDPERAKPDEKKSEQQIKSQQGSGGEIQQKKDADQIYKKQHVKLRQLPLSTTMPALKVGGVGGLAPAEDRKGKLMSGTTTPQMTDGRDTTKPPLFVSLQPTRSAAASVGTEDWLPRVTKRKHQMSRPAHSSSKVKTGVATDLPLFKPASLLVVEGRKMKESQRDEANSRLSHTAHIKPKPVRSNFSTTTPAFTSTRQSPSPTQPSSQTQSQVQSARASPSLTVDVKERGTSVFVSERRKTEEVFVVEVGEDGREVGVNGREEEEREEREGTCDDQNEKLETETVYTERSHMSEPEQDIEKEERVMELADEEARINSNHPPSLTKDEPHTNSSSTPSLVDPSKFISPSVVVLLPSEETADQTSATLVMEQEDFQPSNSSSPPSHRSQSNPQTSLRTLKSVDGSEEVQTPLMTVSVSMKGSKGRQAPTRTSSNPKQSSLRQSGNKSLTHAINGHPTSLFLNRRSQEIRSEERPVSPLTSEHMLGPIRVDEERSTHEYNDSVEEVEAPEQEVVREKHSKHAYTLPTNPPLKVVSDPETERELESSLIITGVRTK